jgi:predicted metal-dependent peptidase
MPPDESMGYYYEVLRSEIPPPDDNEGGGGGGDGQDEGGDQEGSQTPDTGSGDSDTQTPTPPSDEDTGGDSDGSGKGSSGPSQATGEFESHPAAGDDEGGDSDAEREWQQQLMSAATQAEQAGKLPGFVKEMVDRLYQPPEIPWEQALRKFCKKAVKIRATYQRPNRRMAWRGAHVMMIVDTSGSMGVEECNKALSEMESIMKAYPASKITLVQCDTRIAAEVEFSKADTAALKKFARSPEWAGRGGTDMRPAFKRAEELRPECVVLLTDGYFSWPERPQIPTFVLMTTDYDPPWGVVARLK